MIQLTPKEVEITGKWVMVGGRVESDAAAQRIEWLTSSQLQRIGDAPDSGGWEILFQDPIDLRYWELTYPDSELHGGGAPKLSVIEIETAKAKYKI